MSTTPKGVNWDPAKHPRHPIMPHLGGPASKALSIKPKKAK